MITNVAVADRTVPRVSMFVMGTLYSDAGSTPVKIRDLSAGGGLVEGDTIPPAETRISLRRGSLTVTGEVVWRAADRAGLSFAEPITVWDWLPNRRSLAPQQRVDEVVQQIKHAPSRSSLATEPSAATVSALELARAKSMLHSLAEDLARDMVIVTLHGPKLQALDIATQLLGKLAAEKSRHTA